LATEVHAGKIAIVIDDIGNKPQEYEAYSLPTQVAFSILPHTGLSEEFAAKAKQQDREVLLHMPMEALSEVNPGQGALTADMDPKTVYANLSSALQTVPNAIGMNNHMGSKLTQLTMPMSTIMVFLKQKELFFIDSLTTRYSKAKRIGEYFNVPARQRDVFLDDPEVTIKKQFEHLLRIARKRGKALGIGHPYPKTLSFLKTKLANLEGSDIQLITVSSFFELKQSGAEAQPLIENSEVSKL
jgi:polysaccharide deacetylase 2 family uncharacterized protein YibQ